MRAKSKKSRQQTTPLRFLSNIDAQPSTSEGNIGRPFACHNACIAFRNSNFEQFPSSRSSYLCDYISRRDLARNVLKIKSETTHDLV
jgi:hypothetical protein